MRVLTRILWLMLLLLVALTGTAAVWLFASLPRTSGEVEVAHLSARVEIRRDGRGVPHIRAASLADGLFALGYAHAQDRIFQMEMMRRSGAGRLAEVIGSTGVPSDRYMRTLGLYRLAELQYSILEEPTRKALEAYADGVNAWLAARRGTLPVEFLALGAGPEPWQPADSLVWGKMMAVYLSGNWRDEVLRLRLLELVPREVVDGLWPDEPSGSTATVAPGFDGGLLERLVAAHPVPLGSPVGASNAWTVSGSRSATGKPLLANDPHLGFQAPILWYLARIDTPEGRWSGATVPGVPFFVVGHNARVAWGLTTTQSDVEDLFVERVDPADPTRYLAPDGSVPFAVRREVIRVRGGEDVPLDVRSTRHGVVVSDLGRPAVGADSGTVLALAAPYLHEDDRTPQALFGASLSSDCPAFFAALRDFGSPQQTVLCADVEGGTGWLAAGRIPVRAGGDGRYPQAGWTGEADWVGFIPFEELPGGADPAEGTIVAANHRKAPPDYPYELGGDFAPPYRADRIRSLLAGEQVHRRDGMQRLQLDHVSLMARELLPGMTAIEGATPAAREALNLLRVWNGEMSRRRPEPLLFVTWLKAFYRELLVSAHPALEKIPMPPDSLVVREALQDRGPFRCHDRCRPLLESTLESTVAGLRDGNEVGTHRWGDVHVARFAHPFSRVHPAIGSLLDLSIPSDGGNQTVNRGGMRLTDPNAPYSHVHGPGLRAVFDLADLDRSLFVIATGQSGNPVSRHYDDLVADWRDGRPFRIDELPQEPETPTPLLLIPR